MRRSGLVGIPTARARAVARQSPSQPQATAAHRRHEANDEQAAVVDRTELGERAWWALLFVLLAC